MSFGKNRERTCSMHRGTEPAARPVSVQAGSCVNGASRRSEFRRLPLTRPRGY